MKSQKTKENSNTYPYRIYAALKYINQRLDDKLTLEQIASHVLISPFHFHRIFKAVMNETLKKYITRNKLEKSKKLLSITDFKISEIGYQLGYSSPEIFSREFKRNYGNSPSQYRKMYKFKSKSLAQIDNLKSLGVKYISDLRLICMTHIGSYNDVKETYNHLFDEITNNNAKQSSLRTWGIIYDDRRYTIESQLRFDACVRFDYSENLSDAVHEFRIAKDKFMVYEFRGSYDQLYDVYDYIYQEIIFTNKIEFDNRLVLEEYLYSPFEDEKNAQNYITHLYIPVK